jgi:hypothetical protein
LFENTRSRQNYEDDLSANQEKVKTSSGGMKGEKKREKKRKKKREERRDV